MLTWACLAVPQVKKEKKAKKEKKEKKTEKVAVVEDASPVMSEKKATKKLTKKLGRAPDAAEVRSLELSPPRA